VSVGPYINYCNEAGTKNEPDTYFVQVQKKDWKIDPHVSNLRSREFLFQGRSTLKDSRLEMFVDDGLNPTVANLAAIFLVLEPKTLFFGKKSHTLRFSIF